MWHLLQPQSSRTISVEAVTIAVEPVNLCGILHHISSANPKLDSFLIAYLVQISTQHLLIAALIFGLDEIPPPRTYEYTLASIYGAEVSISGTLNDYLLRGAM